MYIISGRGWSQVLEPFLKIMIWGGIPSTIFCGLKLKNRVGDVLALWDTKRRRERTGMGNLGMWRVLAIKLDGTSIICVFEGGDLGRERKTSGKE